MKRIEIITNDYETELIWLKNNVARIDMCYASFVPRHKGKIQLQMRCGDVRQYEGELARKVFNYTH